MRYDMPAVFGPSLMPDQSSPRIDAAVVAFETTPEAAAALVPRFYRVADRPVISVSRMLYEGVDYMGGRGYAELVLSVSAVYEGPEGRIDGPYMPVLWVDDTAAVIAGREFMGYSKLHGHVRDTTLTDSRIVFECAEYEALLMRGELSGLTPMDDAQLAKVQAAAGDAPAFGWKHISGPGGTVDADYPTLIKNRWFYEKAWTGEGHLEWFTPDATAAPYSSRIMAAMAKLPIIKYRRGFRGVGRCEIDRAGTRRLAG